MNISVPFEAISRAIQFANKSEHHKTRVGAVLFAGGKIVKSAFNIGTVHAEERVLRNRPRIAGRGSTLIVARVWKTGQLTHSIPCGACTNLARNCGVRRVVVYFGGEFVEWRL